jgi:hypothetical protein
VSLIHTLQWYDFVRLLTLVASLYTMYMLVHTYAFHKEDFTPRILDHWASKNLFLFTAFFSAGEAIWNDRDPSATLFLICLASLFALSATLRSRDASDIENTPRYKK